MSCEVVTDRKLTPLIGAYLPPSTLNHLPDLEEGPTRFRDQDTILLGDLNAGIVQAHNLRIQQVADLLMESGLMDLIHHFRQCWRLRYMKM